VLGRLGLSVLVLLLAVPGAAQAFTIKGYGVRDTGDEILHRVTICRDKDDLQQYRFEVIAVSELYRGGDPRRRQTSVTVTGCERWLFSYPDTHRYRSEYWGRLRIRLEQTDWVQVTRWRPFYVD
jgi:hypothetical protein